MFGTSYDVSTWFLEFWIMRSSVLVQKWRYFTLEPGTESDFFSILGNCSWLLPATIAGTFRGKVVFGYIFENDFFFFY